MHEFSIEDNLNKILQKLLKRDRITYEALMKKIKEAVECENVKHYKNLRYPLQELKRGHVRGPFVLTFKYLKSEDKIIFYDFDHHDNIYKSGNG